MSITNLELFIRQLNQSIDTYGKEAVSPEDLLDLAEALKADLEATSE